MWDGFSKFVTTAVATVATTVSSVVPGANLAPAVQTSGTWQGTVTVSPVDKELYADAKATELKITSKPAVKDAVISVYDQTGKHVGTCESGDCLSSWTLIAAMPSDSTRTYVAYVSKTKPAEQPPTDTLAKSDAVTVKNLGWVGTVGLVVDPAKVTDDHNKTTVRVTPSRRVVAPYVMSVYDQAGKLVKACGAGFDPCGTGVWSFDHPVPAGVKQSLTAYVAKSAPAAALPAADVRAKSDAGMVENVGWEGSLSLTADRPTVDAHNPEVTLTATAGEPLTSVRRLSIYDGDGKRVAVCGGDQQCVDGKKLVVKVSVADGQSRSFSAFVAKDAPETKVPADDVKASVEGTSVKHVGWAGAVTASVSAQKVDVDDPKVQVVVKTSATLAGGYRLGVYDQAGVRIFECGAGDAACQAAAGKDGHAVEVGLNRGDKKTFTAVIAKTTPEKELPAKDQRAAETTTAEVEHVGWLGTVSITSNRTEVDNENNTAVLTVKASKYVRPPYKVTVYDNTGVRYAARGHGVWCSSDCRDVSYNINAPNNETRTYTAYVAQDVPEKGKPTNDVRATGSVVVKNLGYTGTVSITSNRAEVDNENNSAVLTVKASKHVRSPYKVTVYDDKGVRYAARGHGAWCSSDCRDVSYNINVPNNETRTYTAYVAQDVPEKGKPTNDVRATDSVVVKNLGYTGTVSITSNRAEVDNENNSAVLTVKASKYVRSPYKVTVYDDKGVRYAARGHGAWCSSDCRDVTYNINVPNNETRTYTAYVAQDVPEKGKPTNDARAHAKHSVGNQGFTGTVSITSSRSEVDNENNSAVLTVKASKYVRSPYKVTVYDNTGVRYAARGHGAWCSSDCRDVSYNINVPNNETRTYTAYVAQDIPEKGKPTNDVRATSSVVVKNVGYTGTVSITSSRSEVDNENNSAVLTVKASKYVRSPYKVTVYDNTGVRYTAQSYGAWCSSDCRDVTYNINVPNNETRTYTAYVAQDVPEKGKPTKDVRATSSVVVKNVGYTGTVSITSSRSEVDNENNSAVLTVKASKYVRSPYKVTVYDNTGVRYTAQSYGAWCSSDCRDVTYNINVPNNETRTYTAYVAQDIPEKGKPTKDVRATSSVVVKNVGYTGTVSITSNRSEVDNENNSAVLTVKASKYVRPPYKVTVYDNTGVRYTAQSYGAWCSSDCRDVTYNINVPNNETRTYTAYVAQDIPTEGRPTKDVRATDSVAIRNLGYTGSLTLTTDKTKVDIKDPVATMTVQLSKPLRSPYYLTLYDNKGNRHAGDGTGAWCNNDCRTVTFKVKVPVNETLTYTAAVSQDAPSTGPAVKDVRVPASLRIQNVGWWGSVTLSQVPNGDDVDYLAMPSQAIRSPFVLSIYTSEGFRLTTCGDRCSSLTLPAALVPSPNKGLFAYVSTDSPVQVFPTKNVRAVSTGIKTGGPDSTSATVTSGGINMSTAHTTACSADPVNNATGEFFTNTTDLTAMTIGPKPTVKRSYAIGRTTTNSPFGYGWSTNLSMKLLMAPGVIAQNLATAGQVQVRQENCSTVLFTRTTAGTYTAGPGVRATLRRNADGTFTMTRNKTAHFTFTATGDLASIADVDANTTRFERNTDGKIIKIVGPGGRHIVIDWDGDRIVKAHTPEANQTVTYTYDKAGNLTRVTDVDGRHYDYTYDDKHRITSMTLPGGRVTRNDYDAQSRVVKQTAPDGTTTQWTYGTDGKTTITGPDGVKQVEQYFQGRLMSRTEAAGTPLERVWRFSYTPTGNLATTQDPLGRVTKITYNADGLPTQVVDPLGRVTKSSYDSRGRLTASVDAAGRTSTISYNSKGHIASRKAADGTTTTFTVNDQGLITSATDAAGQTVRYDYDVHGNRTSVTGPSGAKALTRYDARGLLVGETSTIGTTSAATYTAGGQLATATNALGLTTKRTYDAAGNLESVTDAAGNTVRHEYDARGRLTAVHGPAGKTTYAYDAAGRQVKAVAADGGETTTSYDVLGRVTKVTGPMGRSVSQTYDAGDRVVTRTDAAGLVTTFTYDAGDRVVTTTNPAGGVTTRTWDVLNRPVSVTDPDGRKTGFTYAANGWLTKTTAPDGTATTYERDVIGRVVKTTTPAGSVTTTYTPAGQVASTTDQVGRTTTFTYDGRGVLTKTTSVDGDTVPTYDKWGRVVSVDAPGDAQDVTYSYDRLGRVEKVTNTKTGYERVTGYTQLGQVASVTEAGRTVGYGYNRLGQMTTLTYPSGRRALYEFDKAGALTTVSTQAKDDTAKTVVATYRYDQAGRLASVVNGNGVTESLSYDAAGRLARQAVDTASGVSVLRDDVSYSTAGRVMSSHRAGSGGVRVGYGYDLMDRLVALSPATGGGKQAVRGTPTPATTTTPTSKTTPTGSATPTESSSGGKQAGRGTTTPTTTPTPSATTSSGGKQAGRGTASPSPTTSPSATPTVTPGSPVGVFLSGRYVFDAQGRLTGAPGNVTVGYDQTGFAPKVLTSPGGTITYAHDAKGRRTSSVVAGEPTSVGATSGRVLGAAGKSWSYEWGVDSTLTSITQTGADGKPAVGGVKVSYGYAPDGLLLSRAPVGGQVEHVTWNRLAGISRMLALADTEFVYGLGQAPVAQTTAGKADSGGLVWLHTDRLGSVVATTDTAGGVSSASAWGVYGGETSASGSGKRVSSVSVFGFAGEYTDPLSGLVFLRARWLDPTCGSFLSIDPLVAVSGEPYLYAAGSPTVLTDPTGLLPGLSAPLALRANRTIQWLSSQAVQLSQNETLRSVMGDIAHQSAVVAVNFGRGVTGGATDLIVDRISPGASCMVESESASARAAQGLGSAAGLLSPFGPPRLAAAIARTRVGTFLTRSVGKQRTVILGRSMGRVIPYAKANRAGYYKGTPSPLRNDSWQAMYNLPSGRKGKAAKDAYDKAMERHDLWWNRYWLRRQMSLNRKIVDIGPGPKTDVSIFYDMERRMLTQPKPYPHYQRKDQP